MPSKETAPHALVGRAGLVFAFVCFAFALSMFGGAIYLLPLTWKAKLFLAAAAGLLTFMFVSMAVATFLVLRPRQSSAARPSQSSEAAVDGRKDLDVAAAADADSSNRLR